MDTPPEDRVDVRIETVPEGDRPNRVVAAKLITTLADGTEVERVLVAGAEFQIVIAPAVSEPDLAQLREFAKVTKYGMSHSAFTVSANPRIMNTAIRVLRARGVDLG